MNREDNNINSKPLVENHSANNKRLAKNTVILYLRMMFLMVVTLYTSRVILSALGIIDYGLYNVIGGVVAMFSFISAAMGNSSQRFIVYALGKDDLHYQRAVFTTSRIIHLCVAFAIVVLAESIGLWYMNNKMVIPEERIYAAQWVYQFSIIACFINITNVPYNALIIAHEKMSAFAWISIVDCMLKLLIAFAVQIYGGDRLILYAFLFLLIYVFDRILYQHYCYKHFEETPYIGLRYIGKNIFSEIGTFAGWSLIGNLAWIGYTQGLNLVLNIFFGPAVNAARGVAVQVQGAVTNFTKSFQTAINPQIVKSYASGDNQRVRSLVYTSSKFSYYLLLCMALPIMLEAESIMGIWLKEVPDHTVNFVRLILLVLLVGPFENPADQTIQATGKIKLYQIVEGGLLMSILPVSYIALKNGMVVESVFVIQFLVFVIVQFVRLLIIKKYIDLSIVDYLRNVLLPPALVTLISGSLSYLLYLSCSHSLVSTIFVSVVSFSLVLLSSYIVGVNKQERVAVNKMINKILVKIKHQ